MNHYTYFLALILLSVFSGNSTAQSVYHKVWLLDKQSAYDMSRPGEFLSAKSVERRLLQQIPLSESDMPISPDYLEDIRSTGSEIVYKSKWLNLVIVKTNNKSFQDLIKEKPYVKSVESADYLFNEHRATKNKPHFDKENIVKLPNRVTRSKSQKSSDVFNYGASANQVEMIGINHLHALGYTGAGMVIGVIDAGFNSVNIHSAFDSIRLNGQILGTHDFVEPGNDVYATTMNSHGTRVLSTMGGHLPGQLIGTAPKASYWLLRSEDARSEYLMEEYFWVNAAEFADSVGVDIINSSLGYSIFDNPLENHTYADMDGNTTVVTIGADMAAAKGILVVNSAGNSGGDNNPWRYITAPADGDSVFTIGAVNSIGQRANFSSQGPTYDGRTKPDVSAQGVATVTAILPTGIAGGDGTSFSSPLIAGAAACLWQANSTFSNMDLIDAIRSSASKANSPDNYLGWGIPNFLVANNILTSSLIQTANPVKNLKVFPNPFTERLNIEMDLPVSSKLDISIINSQGKLVAGLKSVELAAGKNFIVLNDLGKLPKGIYMLQVTDGFSVATSKVIH
jgi:hypothetical protein